MLLNHHSSSHQIYILYAVYTVFIHVYMHVLYITAQYLFHCNICIAYNLRKYSYSHSMQLVIFIYIFIPYICIYIYVILVCQFPSLFLLELC